MSLRRYTEQANQAAGSRERIKRTGRTPNGHRLWSEEEDAICRRLHPDYRALEKALPQRTAAAIKSRCARLGIRRKLKPWTAKEISALRKHYPEAPLDVLKRMFPDRSMAAIRSAARYNRVYRKRKAYVPTGVSVLDRIRARCFELNYTMTDLDALCRSKRYFSNSKWLSGWISHKAIAHAIIALDGEMDAEWRDRD